MRRFIGLCRRTAGYVALATALSAAVYLPVRLQQTVPSSRPAELTAQTAATVTPEHGQRAWTYDFGSQPDGPLLPDYWNFETGNTAADYNDELQTYTSDTQNVRVENGTLAIHARQQAKDGKRYISGRINTMGKFDFTYGTLEVTMKLPSGTGSWPAAWLLPADPRYKPAQFGISDSDRYAWALNGEIDFMEAVGYIPDQDIPAAHSYNEVQRAPSYTPGYVTGAANGYHRYGIIKTPNSITFTIDGKAYNTRHKNGTSPLDWPYDQPYYLILNLAVGGKWAGAHGVDESSMPWQLNVKSVSYTPL